VSKSISSISGAEAIQLVGLADRYTGVMLEPVRHNFLEARLAPVLSQFSFESFGQLIKSLEGEGNGPLKNIFIDAITTHETYFFRDFAVFALLKSQLIPDFVNSDRSSVLRICSAACSTGQEPYSICMVVDELAPLLEGHRVQVDGYDISRASIETARSADYSNYEVNRGLSPAYIKRYFDKVDQRYRVIDRLRSMVNFKELNLLDDLGVMPTYDIVFCRNIANYFKVSDRVRLFRQLATVIAKGGILITGGSEIVPQNVNEFKPIHGDGCVYYEKL